MNEGNPREAEEFAREAFDAQHRLLGPQHTDTLSSLQYLATALVYNHHYDQAKKLFADNIEETNKIQGGNASASWYNFACVAVAANRPDDAFQDLRQAISLGYSDAEHLQGDDDLKPLHSDPRFASLVSQARTHTLTAREKTQ